MSDNLIVKITHMCYFNYDIIISFEEQSNKVRTFNTIILLTILLFIIGLFMYPITRIEAFHIGTQYYNPNIIKTREIVSLKIR